MKKLIYLVMVGCFYTKVISAAAPHNVINTEEGLESPITTLTADTLSKKSWSFSQRTEYYRTNPLSNTTLLESPDFESQTALAINDLLMGYGLTDNLTIGINLAIQNSGPIFASQTEDETLSPVITNLGKPSGVSDTSLFGLWSIARAEKSNFNTAISSILGVDAPTGKTNVKTNQGELFSASDQPGTGAFLAFGGIICSKTWGNLAISGNLIYTQTTTGTQDTMLGSYFDYNFAGVYPLLKSHHLKGLEYSIDGVLELNGEYIAKDNISGANDPNSGGNTVLIAPGVRLNIGKNFSSYLGVAIPVSQILYGTQVKNTYTIYSGIDLFF